MKAIYEHYITNIDRAAKIDYTWNHLEQEKDKSIWQDVEFVRK